MIRFNLKQGFMPCPVNCRHSVAWHIHDDQTVKCERLGCTCEVPYIADRYPELKPFHRTETLFRTQAEHEIDIILGTLHRYGIPVKESPNILFEVEDKICAAFRLLLQ